MNTPFNNLPLAQGEENNNSAYIKALCDVMKNSLNDLTERQCVVWKLHNNGYTQKEIADNLKLSQPTVCRHLKAAKLKLRCDIEMASFAIHRYIANLE